MATTLKIKNGDVVVNGTTGRPKVIGNIVGESDPGKAKDKTIQDLQRCLSIDRVRNGTGAAISELIGKLDGVGLSSITMLIGGRIRNMFAAIISTQRQGRIIRPNNERFRTISFLQIVPGDSKTDYKFRLDTKTFSDETITQSGTIVSP